MSRRNKAEQEAYLKLRADRLQALKKAIDSVNAAWADFIEVAPTQKPIRPWIEWGAYKIVLREGPQHDNRIIHPEDGRDLQ